METRARVAVAPTATLVQDDARPGALAFWIGIYVFIAVSRVTDFIPGASVVPIAKISFAIALITAFRKRKELSDLRLWSSPISKRAILLLGLATFSIAFSIWRGKSFDIILNVILIHVAVFVLVLKAIRSYETLRILVLALIAAGSLLSCMAIVGYSGGRAEVASSYDTNDLAYVLVTILPITLAWAGSRTGAPRLCYFGLAAMQLLAALLTQSRGGLFGLALVMLLVALNPLTCKAQARGVEGKGASGSFGRVIFLLVLAAVTWSALPSATRARLSTVTSLSSDYNADRTDETARLSLWTRNLAELPGRPIGFGIGAFSALDGRTGGRYMAPHNSLVQVAVELGFIGILLYLSLHYQALRGLACARRAALAAAADSEQALLLRGLAIALSGNFVCAFFLSQAYSNLLWILLATIVVAVDVTRSITPATQPAINSRNGQKQRAVPATRVAT